MPRLLSPAEFHQMAGRAGRPQFDNKGIAITLAPEAVVQEIRKEIKTQKKKGYRVDEEQVRNAVYAKARADASRKQDVIWYPQAHEQLVRGEPAALTSRDRVRPCLESGHPADLTWSGVWSQRKGSKGLTAKLIPPKTQPAAPGGGTSESHSVHHGDPSRPSGRGSSHTSIRDAFWSCLERSVAASGRTLALVACS